MNTTAAPNSGETAGRRAGHVPRIHFLRARGTVPFPIRPILPQHSIPHPVMKNTRILIATLALGLASTTALLAQNGNRPEGGREGRPEGRPGGGRPMMPLVQALDANGDGVIDEDEIKNAVAALKALDKNNDGKLTREEYMGMRRGPGGPGGPGGQGGPGGPGGPGGQGGERRRNQNQDR